ncbi:hypothetical protein CANMA_003542 [Candida margitis]|uniref:uncharacterized protein n=1 Tax=Candida margitis TaxID=1775924 RepID=UPI002227512A|nr:uncharacterized protein CANMA_003542 [Candida margitis]KAI5963945.1 hypothetical protein CANMA_003542 [Candida margitis]
MSANLQTKLETSLNEVLKTAGFVFEVINNNKKQSALITGPNNQLIQPTIIKQLTNHINEFDSILDETIFKFNDAKWCIDTMIENKQKQEELKIKEELERQKREAEAKRLKEEMEAKKKAEEEAAAKAKLEAEARSKAESEAKAQAEKEAAEMERQRKQELEKKEREEAEERQRKEAEEKARQEQQHQQSSNQVPDQFENFDDLMDFDMNDLGQDERGNIDDQNDFLSSMNYDSLNLNMPLDGANKVDNSVFDDFNIDGLDTGKQDQQNTATDNTAKDAQGDKVESAQNKPLENGDDMDLDMNNLLGNDESILDGLNMSLLEGGFDGGDDTNNTNNAQLGDEFDVDNFLNQFGN